MPSEDHGLGRSVAADRRTGAFEAEFANVSVPSRFLAAATQAERHAEGQQHGRGRLGNAVHADVIEDEHLQARGRIQLDFDRQAVAGAADRERVVGQDSVQERRRVKVVDAVRVRVRVRVQVQVVSKRFPARAVGTTAKPGGQYRAGTGIDRGVDIEAVGTGTAYRSKKSKKPSSNWADIR